MRSSPYIRSTISFLKNILCLKEFYNEKNLSTEIIRYFLGNLEVWYIYQHGAQSLFCIYNLQNIQACKPKLGDSKLINFTLKILIFTLKRVWIVLSDMKLTSGTGLSQVPSHREAHGPTQCSFASHSKREWKT